MDLNQEFIFGLLNIAIEGSKALFTMRGEVKKKLARVYLEIRKNKVILLQSGILDTSPVICDDKTFIDVAKKLSNKETSALYNYNKKGILFPNRKKAIQRRKTQYALNYIVKQIDDLSVIAGAKRNSNAPVTHISVRLKTLVKHLNTLEKVLLPVS